MNKKLITARFVFEKMGDDFFPRSRLKAVGSSHLPRVARTLLDAAEGRTTNCPGVKRLDAASIAILRRWAAKAEDKSKQTAK